MELIPVIGYGLLLTFILLYSFVEFHLVLKFLFRKKRPSPEPLSQFPFVTIQLPVYNEKYVVEELLEKTAAIHYPKDKFEIHVLDDSTDETIALIENTVQKLSQQGFLIQHIRRENRNGFKAGALAHGLAYAKGEFIAIFDADFHPDPQFLMHTLPHLVNNEKIGVVQTKWGHHNKNYSLITRLQAFALDAHFTVEQVGRNVSNSFINFNGTAGIWRKTCIETSGGWQSDTLTEDLDLSYRAQLKGWKFIYLKDVVSPAELPVEMNGLKAQQLRWSKGAAECARKHLFTVLKQKNLSLTTKTHATFHLLNSFLYVCILSIGILSLPVIYVVKNHPEHNQLFSLFIVYYIGLLLITLSYLTSELSIAKNKPLAFFEFLVLFPIFLSISMGLSLFNAIGVLEGYFGKKTSFVRTPKFNIKSNAVKWQKSNYTPQKLNPIVLLEGVLFAYFVFCFIQVVQLKNYWSFPYFIMLSMGFGFVFFSSVYHLFVSRK